MEDSGLLSKINSNYIFKNIMGYLEDTAKLSLFKYSKLYKNKLNLDIILYQKQYFQKIGINFFSYLSLFKNEKYPKDFSENDLTNKLKKDLLFINIDIKTIENYIIKFFEDYKYHKDDDIKYLDIFSPLFDLLLKTKIFPKEFYIPISLDFIKENKLEENYISAIDKLNKLNYNLILVCNDENNINYLKELKFNFNNIKYLKIINVIDKNENLLFLKNIFSFNNFGNNLVELHIRRDFSLGNKIESNIIENINNLKFLEKL